MFRGYRNRGEASRYRQRVTPDRSNGVATLYQRLGGCKKIGILVRNFYLALQVDPVLGPVFAAHVQDWHQHFETLTNFWAVQTGGPSNYAGRLIRTHARLEIRPEHYERWLAQWRQSCRLHFKQVEADEMIALAEGLAKRMPGR